MKKRLFWLCLVIMLLSGCNKTCVIGDPDCVSSSSINEDLYLTIVANTNEIEDTKVFAKEILEICKNNSFKSIRLSTDIQGIPEKITAEIYLREEEIGKKEPVLVVEYIFSAETDIVDTIIMVNGK